MESRDLLWFRFEKSSCVEHLLGPQWLVLLGGSSTIEVGGWIDGGMHGMPMKRIVGPWLVLSLYFLATMR